MIKNLDINKDKKHKRNRNYLIIVLILIIVLMISPAAYTMFNEGDNSGQVNTNVVKYNDVTFNKDSNGYWQFTDNGKNYVTRYNPKEINDTNVNTGLLLSSYSNQVLYIEGSTSETYNEIGRNLWQDTSPVVLRMAKACLTDNCTGNFPIKNCQDDKIISYRQPVKDESKRIYKEDNCIFIVANSSNFY